MIKYLIICRFKNRLGKQFPTIFSAWLFFCAIKQAFASGTLFEKDEILFQY